MPVLRLIAVCWLLIAAVGAAPALGATGATITCRVNVGKPLGEVPRGLFGTNVEWFDNGNGLWDQTGGLNQGLMGLARQQGVSVVRFPGGTLSDFYHWRDGVGPRAKRPVRSHGTDKGTSANTFGTPELMLFCRSIGAVPLLTVNAGTGTAEEAAAWVAYCNSPTNPERAADGFPAPLGVKYWEVGNELYLDGSPVEDSLTVKPEEYARRFLAYARAMRAVDPGISLLAIARANSFSVPFGPYPNWNETLLRTAAHEIDALALHNAYFPSVRAGEKPSIREVYSAMWAAPEAVARDLDETEALIRRYEKGRHIGLAITEWGPLFSATSPEWLDHVKTQGSSVFVARMFQVMLEHPRLTLATYFKFVDATFMGWVARGKGPKSPYHALRLYARHFGSRLVQATVEGSPRYDVPKTGYVPALRDVAEVTAVASLDAEGKTLFVNLVNRSWDTPRTVAIQVAGFTCAPGSIRHELSSADATANNGPDLPTWWPFPVVEPGPARPDGREITLVSSPGQGLDQVTLPPHSVVTIELHGAIAVTRD